MKPTPDWIRQAALLASIDRVLVGVRKPPWWRFGRRRIYRQAKREFAKYGKKVLDA